MFVDKVPSFGGADAARRSASPLGIMTEARPHALPPRPEAVVLWADLMPDILLLLGGALAVLLSFMIDVRVGRHDYFSRSGAIAALLSGVVAYRSLNKHYRKFLYYSELSKVPVSCMNMTTTDVRTLVISLVCTAYCW